MKKIFIFIFLAIMVSSCGKKGDPVFEEQKTKIIDTDTIVVL